MKHTVIVTGGTKGLGREISLAFATTGCFVIALYANDEKAARELEERFAAEGLAGCAIRHDVTNEGGQAWSRPEIQEARELTVIHCACASFVPTPMHLLKWTDFERQMAVALRGALGAFQALLRPMLKKDRATWVNVLTTALENEPPKGFAAYATAKHALRGWTLSLAAEYASRGLRVFTVSPGFMETPLTAAWDARFREAMATGTVTDPAVAAQRVRELVEAADTPGRGENYLF